GSLAVKLGLDIADSMMSREVSGTGGSECQSHIVIDCPADPPVPPQVFDRPSGFDWMELPQVDEQKVEVKADGTIQGTYTRTYMAPLAGTRTMTWMLTPLRQ